MFAINKKMKYSLLAISLFFSVSANAGKTWQAVGFGGNTTVTLDTPCSSVGITAPAGTQCTILDSDGVTRPYKYAYFDTITNKRFFVTANDFPVAQWHTANVKTNLTADTSGNGPSGIVNTNTYIAQFGVNSTAFGVCASKGAFLPSRNELFKMWTPGSMSGNYWSSTENDANSAWYVNGAASSNPANKTIAYLVRCAWSL